MPTIPANRRKSLKMTHHEFHRAADYSGAESSIFLSCFELAELSRARAICKWGGILYDSAYLNRGKNVAGMKGLRLKSQHHIPSSVTPSQTLSWSKIFLYTFNILSLPLLILLKTSIANTTLPTWEWHLLIITSKIWHVRFRKPPGPNQLVRMFSFLHCNFFCDGVFKWRVTT